jgi:serine protease Do
VAVTATFGDVSPIDGETAMSNSRMSIYAGVLAAGVAAGVASLAAQAPVPPAPPAPPAAPRAPRAPQPPERRMLMLEGRGSQIGVVVRDGDATVPGVHVDEVDADSPAQRAGVRSGDLITEFDGERVRSARQFTRLVQETAPGQRVSMSVQRDGQRQALQITPEDRVTSWAPGIDADEIRREVERGLQGLRDLPHVIDAPGFRFRMETPTGPRGRLGVQVERLTPQLEAYFGAPDGGVLVAEVTPASPAEKAGLKAGDVITAVNGTSVRDAGDLVEELREAGAGSQVEVRIVRDRTSTTLKATLEPTERPRTSRRGRPA